MDPAIPPGLRQLCPSLKRFVNQFEVPTCLVAAMAEASRELVEIPATDFSSLIPQLSREECDGFLCRFAQGDTTAGMELKKRLLSHSVPADWASGPSVFWRVDEKGERDLEGATDEAGEGGAQEAFG